jgi:hypothetical protein
MKLQVKLKVTFNIAKVITALTGLVVALHYIGYF